MSSASQPRSPGRMAGAPTSNTPNLLELSRVRTGYGRVEVVHGVDLHIAQGEMVTLVGANGSGKSTLLKAIVGFLPITAGEARFDGGALTGARPETLVRRGVSLVPEGRMLFGPMTVRENLELGAYSAGRARARAIAPGLKRVHELFPVLEERASQSAATLSGGEQQMLAVGRALMSEPRLLLLDEPSLGLAPLVIAEIFSALDRLKGEGMTILLVEQDAKLALKHADRGYVMRSGRVVLEGDASDLLADESIRAIYLGSWGVTGEGS